MKFVKISVLVSTILLSISFCNAQSTKHKKTVAQKSETVTEKLNKEVKLSPTQFKQINTINVEYISNKRGLDKKIKVLSEAKKKLKKERKTKIDTILTSEQIEQRKQFKKKNKKKK